MLPNYLHDMIPSTTRTCASRNVTNIHVVLVNNNYFMNTLFQSTITEWNKLDLNIRNSASLTIFEGRLLLFLKPLENKT